MEDRYHYCNGSVAICERRPCGFQVHMSLSEAMTALRADETNAFYSLRAEA